MAQDIHLVRGNHILREANLQVANLLAKRGVELHDGVHVFHSPPTRNQLAMLADVSSVYFSLLNYKSVILFITNNFNLNIFLSTLFIFFLHNETLTQLLCSTKIEKKSMEFCSFVGQTIEWLLRGRLVIFVFGPILRGSHKCFWSSGIGTIQHCEICVKQNHCIVLKHVSIGPCQNQILAKLIKENFVVGTRH